MQTALPFDDGEPPTAIWQIRCPTCDAPSGVTCVTAGEKEPPTPGPGSSHNHEAREEKFRQIRREVRRRRRKQNPLINTEADA
jgi:hypothetical protein